MTKSEKKKSAKIECRRSLERFSSLVFHAAIELSLKNHGLSIYAETYIFRVVL